MRKAISTTYVGPTNHRGSRIKAKCDARTIFVPWDDGLGVEANHGKAMVELARLMGWTNVRWYGGGVEKGYVWVQVMYNDAANYHS